MESWRMGARKLDSHRRFDADHRRWFAASDDEHMNLTMDCAAPAQA